MAIRKIIVDGDDRLRKVSKEVTDFGSRTQMIIDDMIDTLHHTGNGIGLAAVQVGILRRIFIVDIEEDGGLQVFVNPKIVATEGEQCSMEGCLSVPDYWGDVKRPAKIRVEAQDRYGEPFTLEAEGLRATCICHENDHLDGVLFTDKVEGPLQHAAS